jgi:hypothetical protein
MYGKILALAAATAVSFSVHATVTSLNPSGQTVSENKVTAFTTAPENSNKGVDELLLKYPDIARDLTTLSAIDRAVYTDAGTIDLYAGNNLLMIVEQKEKVWVVGQSLPLFQPSSVSPMMDQTNTNLIKQIEFTFRGCEAANGVETCESVRTHVDFQQIVAQ